MYPLGRVFRIMKRAKAWGVKLHAGVKVTRYALQPGDKWLKHTPES